MKVALFALISYILTSQSVFGEEFKLAGLFFGCERDLTYGYHKALQDFSTKLFKEVAAEKDDHFAMSQYSAWLALSAIAEGSLGHDQEQLFKALNLPSDSCYREKYYEIATALETSADDVSLTRKRLLVLDNDLEVNSSWVQAVRSSGLIDTMKLELQNDIEAKNELKQLVNGTLNDLKTNGNSLLLDSLEYQGLWTTAFDNATTELKADFYDDSGKKIGKVDLLKVKMRVKLAYIPLLNAKLMELPVGNNGRYRMLFIMNQGKTSIRRTVEHFPNSFIVDFMPLLIESVVPLEVSIPRFEMTSEMDLRKALERVGFESIWKSENVSQYISTPHLNISSVYQRVSIKIDQDGLTSHSSNIPPSLSNVATGLAGIIGRDFKANRPFIYGLVDSQTRTWLFAGVFSKPNGGGDKR